LIVRSFRIITRANSKRSVQYLYARYRELLAAFLESGHRIVTVEEAARGPISGPFLVLRHDVEWSAARARDIAAVEQGLGVRSTLYFRHDTKARDVDVMLDLQEQGFDVGYHYNTLDRSGGDFDLARRLFEAELSELRGAGIAITSATPHGDPGIRRTGYDTNGDLVRRFPDLLRAQGLLAIGRFGTRFPLQGPLLHVSDANMRWNRGEITWPFFFRIARERSVPRIFLLVHADYWSGSRTRAHALNITARGMRRLRLRSAAPRYRSCAPEHRVAARVRGPAAEIGASRAPLTREVRGDDAA
jgi:hypothetical protein